MYEGAEAYRNALEASNEKVREAVQLYGQALQQLQEGLTTFQAISEGTQSEEMRAVTSTTAEAAESIRGKTSELVIYPELLNPYLGRLGVAPLTEISTPEVPEPAPLDPESYQLEPATEETPTSSQAHEAGAAYQDWLNEITGQLDNGANPESLPGYIGHGGNCYVYQDERADVVIKVPRVIRGVEDEHGEVHDELPGGHTIQKAYLEPLEKGKGVDGLEQLVGVIDSGGEPGEGAIICEKASGEIFNDIPRIEQQHIPRRHIEKFFETLEAMEERGLLPDHGDENFLYDPTEGFTIIDYETVDYVINYEPFRTNPKTTAAANARLLGSDRGAFGHESVDRLFLATFISMTNERYGRT